MTNPSRGFTSMSDYVDILVVGERRFDVHKVLPRPFREPTGSGARIEWHT
jgi:hypothetical protein